MKPKQVMDYLEKQRISRRDFARRLGITEQALSFWIKQGWIVHERQCQIEIESRGKLRASWNDVPAHKRPSEERAA